MTVNHARIEPGIAQIALSVSDIAASAAWYEPFGLAPTGGLDAIAGEPFASVIGLPTLDCDMRWLVGSGPLMQLELFHFRKPVPHPLTDWSLASHGYGFMSVAVQDFAAQHDRLSASGEPVIVTGQGGARSLWVQSPDRMWVELLEADVPGLAPAAAGQGALAGIRAVSLTVDDLRQAVAFWTEVMGLTEADAALFDAPPEAITGGVDLDAAVLRGRDVFLRVFQPKGRAAVPPAEGASLADLGLLNIAFILSSRETFLGYVDQLAGGGFAASTEPVMPFEGAGMMYGHDRWGNSVETGFVAPGMEERFGWRV